MDGRRTFDEHVELFVAYGNHVASLSPAAWDRLRQRCATLDGPSFRSLVSRALLSAKAHELWLPEETRHHVWARGLAGISRAVQRGLALTGELAMEFDLPEERSPSSASPSPYHRTESTGEATTDAYIDAMFLIESALALLAHENRGIATVVRAAGQAVLRHDWLPRADFDAVYAFIEPEIPFAALEPPRSDTSN
jgi:hypothetical protein